MKTAIFGNEYQPHQIAGISRLISGLMHNSVSVDVESDFAQFLLRQGLDASLLGSTFAAGELPADADLVLSLGGDGTFLTTVMWVGRRELPIVGINTGHLGYLTAYRLDEAPGAVEVLVAGDYDVQPRVMLEVDCPGGVEHPYALNDVAILRHDTSAMLEMGTALGQIPLTTYVGDGLIVSTPTGSTAYNLSAGGPIVAPRARCLVLSPVSPHSLTMRPLVVPDDAPVAITTRSRAKHYQVSIDGEVHLCPAGSTVVVRRAPFQAMVVQPRGHNFADTLRQKLHWGS